MIKTTSKAKENIPGQQWFAEATSYFRQPATIIRGYKKANLRPDLIAGLTVAVVMLPQAIAYALMAELPPQTGLYAAIIGAIVGALWGSSWHLHTGPTNANSLLTLGALLAVASPGTPEYLLAAGLLAVMVGGLQLALGLAHMGFLTNFVSHSVVVGFTAGAGILIMANQLRHLLRLSIPGTPEFGNTVYELSRHIADTHTPSLMLGGFTILIIAFIKKVYPKWPSALIGMISAAIIVAFMNLDQEGVLVLGELPRQLPPLQPVPILNWSMTRDLALAALAISAIGLVEATSSARAIAAQSGQRLNSNQEFIGLGLANIAVGFFSGYPVSGSITRTTINYEAQAQTAVSSIFSGLWVLLAMFLFAPFAVYIPRAALAGVLIVTAFSMIDRKEMVHIWQTSKGDGVIMLATILAMLALPLEFAVLAGILVSFARYIAKTSTPNVFSEVPDEEFAHFQHETNAQICPQLGVLTIGGSLYFGATNHVEDAIHLNLENHPEQRFLLLRMHRVNHCDVSGLHMLESIVHLYRENGGDVFMVGVRREVWRKMRAGHFAEFLGFNHFLSQERAIEYIFYKILDPAQCIYKCPVKIWRECQTLPKSPVKGYVPLGTLVPATAVIPHITSQELWQELNNGAGPIHLIDVREPYEFAGGHIPDAELIPMPQILGKEVHLPTDENIVLVCRTGRRTTQIVYALQQEGYHNLRNMVGGMVAWEKAGLPAVIE